MKHSLDDLRLQSAKKSGMRFVYVYSVAVVIAIGALIAKREFSYLVQAIGGIVLIGYVLYVVRVLNRKRKSEQNKI
jgi:Ca2+/Na+ antiporter